MQTDARPTPAPWRVTEDAAGTGIEADAHVGRLASVYVDLRYPAADPDAQAVRDANAAAIVACYNACAALNPADPAAAARNLHMLPQALRKVDAIMQAIEDGQEVSQEDSTRMVFAVRFTLANVCPQPAPAEAPRG